MKKKIKITLLFLTIFVSFFICQNISKANGLILIKGRITDKIDSKPESVEIRFEDEKGKFFKIQSNSLTGNFEQILEADKVYKVRLNSKIIFPTEYTITTIKTEKYAEQEQNFWILRLEPGRIIGGFDFFEDNSPNLQKNIRVLFDELNVKMKFNRNITCFFEISAYDSRSSFYEIKPSKNKKKSSDTMFIQKSYDDLVAQRWTVLSNEIRKLSTAADRIDIRISKNAKDEKNTFSTAEKGPDVIIRVKEVIEKIK